MLGVEGARATKVYCWSLLFLSLPLFFCVHTMFCSDICRNYEGDSQTMTIDGKGRCFMCQ